MNSKIRLSLGIVAVTAFFSVLGCSSGKDEGKPVPKPDPVAQIPAAAEVQIDDSVIVEKEARVRARIDRAMRDGTLRKVEGRYEVLVTFRDPETKAEVRKEWQAFDPFKEWK